MPDAMLHDAGETRRGMSLYAHVPYCLSKCSYCALASRATPLSGVPDDFGRLAAREFALRAPGWTKGRPTGTIYFGGGTPAMLGADGLSRMADALFAEGLAADGSTEWTVEFNPCPSLVGGGLFERMLSIGVNRASFGVQSLDDAVLAAVGRRHTAGEAREAVAAARRAGFENVGIDLIAGLPGDSPEKWRATLEAAVSLDIRHISVYSLIVEPGTPLARAAAADAPLCGDSELLDRLAEAEAVLAGAGFARYEISNYAKPGFECRHNLGCWRGDDYLGIGPGAASRIGLSRRTNAADDAAWRIALAAGAPPPAESEEVLSAEDDAEERFVFGLRMAEGVAPAEFASRHPAALPMARRWVDALKGLAAVGIARELAPGGRWALTPRGREVADSAIEELLA